MQKAIRDTGYVADPIAAAWPRAQPLLGVFTYEPAFPSAQADFFAPFLFGIEEAAQPFGYDLLLLTGAPATDGRGRNLPREQPAAPRRWLHDPGPEFDRAELARLVAGDYPFVAVGRREDAGGPVPYVGADYAAATAELVRRAVGQGHRRLAYVGWAAARNRRSTAGRASAALEERTWKVHESARRRSRRSPRRLLRKGATVALVAELADAVALDGRPAPQNGGAGRPLDCGARQPYTADRQRHAFTSFASRARRWAGGVEILTLVIGGEEGGRQVLLPCEPAEGETLGPVRQNAGQTEETRN